MRTKEELKFALEEDGEQYVMILGIFVMQRLCVGNLEWEAQVNKAMNTILSKERASIGATAYGGSRYNPGSGPLHLDDVACSGFEQNINECSKSNFGYVSINCRSHFEDASVFCPIGKV